MNADQQDKPALDLEQRIDAIESGYEFLLAYAAQGRETDQGAGQGRNVREFLEKMEQALDGLATAVKRHAANYDAALIADSAAFFNAVDSDAHTAQAAVHLVLARPDISSQLVDNLNASIHIRAVLTDLFIIDEAFKGKHSA